MGKLLIIIALLFTFVSCGKYEAPLETRLIARADGSAPTLTEENHTQGWKERDCYMCHISDGFHPDDSTFKELSTCTACHGSNGL